MLKISGGKFKGRVLQTPKGDSTRPTSSRTREAVFSICYAAGLGEADFLDLFSGTGAMGLEALSRGAHSATFVESHPEALRCLKNNIASLGVAPSTHILPIEAIRALEKLQGPFEIIYIDPPYDYTYYQSLLDRIDDLKLLSQQGRLFLETRGKIIIKKTKNLMYIEERKMGDTSLHMFTA